MNDKFGDKILKKEQECIRNAKIEPQKELEFFYKEMIGTEGTSYIGYLADIILKTHCSQGRNVCDLIDLAFNKPFMKDEEIAEYHKELAEYGLVGILHNKCVEDYARANSSELDEKDSTEKIKTGYIKKIKGHYHLAFETSTLPDDKKRTYLDIEAKTEKFVDILLVVSEKTKTIVDEKYHKPLHKCMFNKNED